jgi:peptide/nickel transport system substrate-binding protein
VLDATTLKVYLKTPNAGFLAILASDYGCIVSKKVVTEHGHLRDIAVGTGPFKLEKWENGIETVFAKNEYYYKAGRPYLDKIIYKIIPDEMSALAALKTKQVDLARVNDPKNVKLLDQAGIEILRTPENGYLYFCLNTNIKPFGDIKVRQAISMAIDRKEILRVVGQNDGVVLGVLSPGHAEFSVPFADLPYVKLDLAKAKQLLSEAGFAGGFSFECISLLPGDYPNAANATLMIQSQLKQIGIDMKVTQLELATFLNRIDKLQDAPAHLSINSGRADPDDQLYAFFHSTGGYNRAHIKDADLDKYLDLGRSTLDRAARIKAYRDFQFRLVELAPMFFLYSQNQLDAYRDYVKGFKQNAMYTYRYMEDVWVEK